MGLAVPPDQRWALTLYGMLTPEQREMARCPAGLAYSEMNARQRRLVEDAEPPMAIGAERASQLRFQISEHAGEEEEGRRYTAYHLTLEAAGEPMGMRGAVVRLLQAAPRPSDHSSASPMPASAAQETGEQGGS
jgi:hypothetical protein